MKSRASISKRSGAYCRPAGPPSFPSSRTRSRFRQSSGRVMIVGPALAVVAEEEVEALRERLPFRAGIAEAPFADEARRVAFVPEKPRQRRRPRRQGGLAFRLDLGVVPDVGVPGVEAGQQDASRRRADRAARIRLGEARPFGGQPVDVGRPDPRLSVAAELGPAQVVREDEDDVGFRAGGPAGRSAGRRERRGPRPGADGGSQEIAPARHALRLAALRREVKPKGSNLIF